MLSRYKFPTVRDIPCIKHTIICICQVLKLRSVSDGHSAIHARLSSTHKNTILMAPAYNNISAEIWNAVLNLAYFFPLAFHGYFIRNIWSNNLFNLSSSCEQDSNFSYNSWFQTQLNIIIWPSTQIGKYISYFIHSTHYHSYLAPSRWAQGVILSVSMA